jgi:alpha-N-acetylglucosaminidase
MQNTTSNSRVGVMIRESNNENAAYVFCGLSPGFGALASGHGDAATFNVGGTTFSAAAPYWLRVSRVGATITTSISSDGVTWNALGGTYAAPWVSMGTSVTVGLAVHSAGAQVATGTFDNVTTTGTVPPLWTGAAIGSATGSFQQTGAAALTVTGSGTTMSGNTVQHYYAYQTASDDCSITARVVSMQNTTANTRVGVMIRESNNENAAYVFCGLSPGSGAFASGHGTGATFNVGGTTFSAAAPYWVRVSRVGATITTSISSDGVTWNALGGTYTAPWVSMGTSVTVGLAVHSAGAQVATGTFDNVTVEP